MPKPVEIAYSYYHFFVILGFFMKYSD